MNNRDDRLNKNKYRRLRKKKRSRVNLLRLLLLILIILTLISIGLIISKFFKKKDRQKVDNQVQNQQVESKLGVAKIMSSKTGELNKMLDSYITNMKLDKSMIRINYKSLDQNFSYSYAAKKEIPLKKNNTFILSMLVEDLKRDIDNALIKSKSMKSKERDQARNVLKSVKLLDFNKEYSYKTHEKDGEAKQVEKINKVTLENMLAEMIKSQNDDIIAQVESLLKSYQGQDWRQLVEKRYKIKINKNDIVNIEDLSKLLVALMEKKEEGYKYPITVNAMLDIAQDNKDFSNIGDVNFIGVAYRFQYKYTMESAFVMGSRPYVYSIQTDYSDKSINNGLRKIINDWNKQFEKL